MSFIFYANNVEHGVPTGYHALHDSAHPSPDAVLISPKCKVEVNKVSTAEFTILPNHYFYDQIEKMTTLIYAFYCGSLVFRGRVADVNSDFYGQKKVTCDGDLSFLRDGILNHTSYGSQGATSAPSDLLGPILNTYNNGTSLFGGVDAYKHFSVGNVTVPSSSGGHDWHVSIDDTEAYPNPLDIIRDHMVKAHGGIIQTRTENFGTENETHYVDYLADPTQTEDHTISDQEIRFGLNLLDVSEQSSGVDTFTRLVPLQSNNSPMDYYIQQDTGIRRIYISDPDLEDRLGVIYKVEQWDDTSGARAYASAKRYYSELAGGLPSDISCKIIDLKILDPSQGDIRIGNYVKVYTPRETVNRVLFCRAIDYDFLNPENTTCSLGRFVPEDYYYGSKGGSAGKGGKGNISFSLSEAQADSIETEKTVANMSDRFKDSYGKVVTRTIQDQDGNDINVYVAM